MDSGESPGLGALLGLAGAGPVGALGAGENAAGSNDQDVAVRELLLELTGEAGLVSGVLLKRVLPKTYRCWTRWKPCREGTGTKTTIAFLPWPTSI